MATQEEIDRRIQKLESQNQALQDNVTTLVNKLETMALFIKQTNENNVRRDFNIAKLFRLIKSVILFIVQRNPEFDIDLHQNKITDLDPEK